MNRPTEDSIQSVLSHWGMNLPVSFIRKVENFVYSVDNHDCILRITESSHRDLETLKAEIDWMDFLESQNVHFAHPIKNKRGNLVETFTFENKESYAVVFKMAQGRQMNREEDFSQPNMHRWGEVVGNLHRTTGLAPKFNRPNWRDDGSFNIAKEAAMKGDSDISKAFLAEISWLERLKESPDGFGLVHGDIHMGNFFVDESGEITLFDFDDCNYHWFAYDIAVPIFSLMYIAEMRQYKLDIRQLYGFFMESYLQKYQLSEFWIEQIPRFIRFRSNLMYWWSKSKMDSNEIGKEHFESMKKQMSWAIELVDRSSLF